VALASECRGIVESAPDNLQQSARVQALENSADELESVEAPEVPAVLAQMRVKYSLPKRRYRSREARASDVATMLEACASTLEGVPEGDDRHPQAQAVIGDLRSAIDTIEVCEFPGMCG
jgi:hypothetical protein